MVLAVVAIQIGLAHPAHAEGTADSDRSISELLPLFGMNHCEAFRDPAEQLFCGDPELNAAAAKLNDAIQDRLNRLANRRLAIEENAEWIRDRNSSCGIFGKQSHFVAERQTCPGLPAEGNAGTYRNTDRSEFRLPGDEYHRRHADMQRPIVGNRKDGTQ